MRAEVVLKLETLLVTHPKIMSASVAKHDLIYINVCVCFSSILRRNWQRIRLLV